MLMNVLADWKRICPKSDLDLIFPNGNGNPVNSKNMYNREFKPALKSAKLPDIRFHDLRHTFASIMIRNGENI